MTSASDTPTPANGPVRTCVGCRTRAPRSDLVRLVLDGTTQRVVVDPRRGAPGRGAWLHPSRECLDLAERRRAVGRSLRLTGPADLAEVRAWFDRNTPTSSDTAAGTASHRP